MRTFKIQGNYSHFLIEESSKHSCDSFENLMQSYRCPYNKSNHIIRVIFSGVSVYICSHHKSSCFCDWNLLAFVSEETSPSEGFLWKLLYYIRRYLTKLCNFIYIHPQSMTRENSWILVATTRKFHYRKLANNMPYITYSK